MTIKSFDAFPGSDTHTRRLIHQCLQRDLVTPHPAVTVMEHLYPAAIIINDNPQRTQ